jgi:hypothetical protein
MKTIFILLFLLSNSLIAQNLIDYSIEEVDWKKWDALDGNNQAKLDFVGNYFVEKRGEDGAPNSFVPADAKIMDLDGDGISDMLYVDAGTFWVYLNKNDSLKIIHAFNEQITGLLKSWPDAPINITTVDFNCCEVGEWEINYYQFLIEDSNFHYKTYRTEILRQGTKDLFRNMPPTQVKVAASSADIVCEPGSSEIIKTYKTGRTGYAIASIKDENGRLWWKVYIKEPSYKLRVGWMEKNKLISVYQK